MPGTAGTPAAATDDLALLPIDSEIVLGVNFAQLSHSAAWQKWIAPKLAAVAGLQKFQTLCGFDPLASLQSIAAGIHQVAADKPVGVIVLRGFDRAKSMTCFDSDGLAEAQKDGTKVVIDGGYVLMTQKDGTQVGFTFVDDKTAVAVLGPDGASKAGIQHATTGNNGLNSSPAFAQMYAQINRSDSLWMLVHGSPLTQLAAVGIKPKAIFGSVNVTDGVALDARVRMPSPDEANSLVQLAQAQIANPQVKTFFDQLDVNADGPDARFTLAMSEAKLATLMSLAGGMMGNAGNGP